VVVADYFFGILDSISEIGKKKCFRKEGYFVIIGAIIMISIGVFIGEFIRIFLHFLDMLAGFEDASWCKISKCIEIFFR